MKLLELLLGLIIVTFEITYQHKKMKKFSILLVAAFVFFAASQVSAQDAPKVVKLTQVDGKFTKSSLNLKPGKYIFEVTNKKVDREVGLVVANTTEEGKAGDHIKAGYLANTIKKGETARSQVVELGEGTYKYFCPLNPTPEYTITVSE